MTIETSRGHLDNFIMYILFHIITLVLMWKTKNFALQRILTQESAPSSPRIREKVALTLYIRDIVSSTNDHDVPVSRPYVMASSRQGGARQRPFAGWKVSRYPTPLLVPVEYKRPIKGSRTSRFYAPLDPQPLIIVISTERTAISTHTGHVTLLLYKYYFQIYIFNNIKNIFRLLYLVNILNSLANSKQVLAWQNSHQLTDNLQNYKLPDKKFSSSKWLDLLY